MESTEFCSGYRKALYDLERQADAFRAVGSSMTNYDIARWLEQRREYIDGFERGAFGSDFAKTITGTSTGPQDGLRRGADTP